MNLKPIIAIAGAVLIVAVIGLTFSGTLDQESEDWKPTYEYSFSDIAEYGDHMVQFHINFDEDPGSFSIYRSGEFLSGSHYPHPDPRDRDVYCSIPTLQKPEGVSTPDFLSSLDLVGVNKIFILR